VGVRMDEKVEEKEILREKGRDGRERTREMERVGEKVRRERVWKIKREEREREKFEREIKRVNWKRKRERKK
jgi:hypothetical protein